MSVRPFYLVGTFFSRTMLLDLGGGLCHRHNQDSPLLCTTDMTPDSCAALISECTTTPPFWEAHCTVKLIPSAANLYAPHGDSGLLEPYQMDWDGTAVAHTHTPKSRQWPHCCVCYDSYKHPHWTSARYAVRTVHSCIRQ